MSRPRNQTLTTSEWLTELSRVLRTSSPDAVTVEELAQQLGRSQDWTRRCLVQLERAGHIRITRLMRYQPRLDGQLCPRPAYRIERITKP